MARQNQMYLVANMGDKQPCDPKHDPNCPEDKRYKTVQWQLVTFEVSTHIGRSFFYLLDLIVERSKSSAGT